MWHPVICSVAEDSKKSRYFNFWRQCCYRCWHSLPASSHFIVLLLSTWMSSGLPSTVCLIPCERSIRAAGPSALLPPSRHGAVCLPAFSAYSLVSQCKKKNTYVNIPIWKCVGTESKSSPRGQERGCKNRPGIEHYGDHRVMVVSVQMVRCTYGVRTPEASWVWGRGSSMPVHHSTSELCRRSPWSRLLQGGIRASPSLCPEACSAGAEMTADNSGWETRQVKAVIICIY